MMNETRNDMTRADSYVATLTCEDFGVLDAPSEIRLDAIRRTVRSLNKNSDGHLYRIYRRGRLGKNNPYAPIYALRDSTMISVRHASRFDVYIGRDTDAERRRAAKRTGLKKGNDSRKYLEGLFARAGHPSAINLVSATVTRGDSYGSVTHAIVYIDALGARHETFLQTDENYATFYTFAG